MNKVVEKGGEVLLEKGLEVVLGKVAGGFAAAGLIALDFFDGANDERKDAAKERARAVLHCEHIDLCPKGSGTPVSDMVNWCVRTKGMAFLFDGVALCHPTQANFDVGRLSTRVCRWDAKSGDVIDQNHGMSLRPCEICSGAKK